MLDVTLSDQFHIAVSGYFRYCSLRSFSRFSSCCTLRTFILIFGLFPLLYISGFYSCCILWTFRCCILRASSVTVLFRLLLLVYSSVFFRCCTLWASPVAVYLGLLPSITLRDSPVTVLYGLLPFRYSLGIFRWYTFWASSVAVLFGLLPLLCTSGFSCCCTLAVDKKSK